MAGARPNSPGVHPALQPDSSEDLFEHAPCGYLTTLPDGSIIRVNQTFLTWLGRSRDDVLGLRFVDLLTDGGRIYHETHLRPLLEMQGHLRQIAVDLVGPGGGRLAVLLNAVLHRDSEGQPVAVRTTVFDASERQHYERELLRERRAAEDAAATARALHEHSSFLARLSRCLDEADGWDERAARLVELVGGELVGAAELWDVDAVGRVRPTVNNGSPGPGAESLSGDVGSAVRAAVDTGEPVLRGELSTPTTVDRVDGGAALAALPMTVRGRTSGVLVLWARHDRLRFTPEVRPFLTELAGRAALSLDNARLYERERSTALTLQRSLLAGAVPDDPRLRIAAAYRPAVEGLEVGGDWHDAFTVGPNRIGVVVGDVVGRGIAAAAAMGQLRSATRAVATSGVGPARVLEGLDQFVAHLDAGQMTTVAYVEIDLDSGRATYACAGHPPPVLVHEGTSRLLWDGRSPPLGAHIGGAPRGPASSEPGCRTDATVDLSADDRLVLYTDGLVERRRSPLQRSIDRLAALAAREADLPVASLVDALTAELLAGVVTPDDVCVVAIGRIATGPFHRRLRPLVSDLRALRADLQAWLCLQDPDRTSVDALVLAANEAAANAIEHGIRGEPGGTVTVRAERAGDEIRIDVVDEGTWRAPEDGRFGGRGLTIVGRLVDHLEVHRDGGTRVHMRRRVGGPA
ncbi:MAG: SpoIIE family protein phosphatase [Actinobacteria bacterium]|nr:SpoIIE family protein phosphatase [Actinomycetota bacterium]